MPVAPINAYALGGLQPCLDPEDAVLEAVRAAPGLTNFPAGGILGQTTVSADAVQTIASASLSAGTFKINFRGSSTTPLNKDSTLAQVQAALDALPPFGGASQVVVTGTTDVKGANLVLTFSGSNFTKQAVELVTITIITALTGATLAVTNTTTGGNKDYYGAYADANTDGTGIAKAINKYKFSTDGAGNITFAETPTGEEFGQTRQTAPVYFSGTFRIEDLSLTPAQGFIDAAAVTDLGARVLSGSIASGVGILRVP